MMGEGASERRAVGAVFSSGARMDVCITLDDGTSQETFYLTNTRVWVQFISWIESFPDDDRHAALRKVVSDGHFKGTDRLAVALALARQSRRRKGPDVTRTARELAKWVGVGDSNESAIVAG